MLLSAVAIGVSAARVVTVTETPGVSDNAWFAIGENYNANTDGVTSNDFTYELVVYGSSEANNGKASEYNPTMGFGPEISFQNDKIGYGDVWLKGYHNLLDYDLQTEKWTTIKYEVVDGDTTVYVDGNFVGTLSGDAYPMKAAVGNTNYGTYVGSIKITDLETGNVVFSEGFDSVPSDATGGSIESVEVVAASTTVKNENVAVKKENAWFAIGENYNANTDGVTSNDFTYELVVYGSSEANNGKASEYNPTMGFGPEISFQNDKIGYGDVWIKGYHNLLDYDLQTEKWTTITYEVIDGDTTVYVDGDFVGTLSDDANPMKAAVGNTNYGTYVGSIKITDLETGNVVFSEGFDSVPSDATGGSIESFDVEGNRYDLGAKYWFFHEGNSYAPIEVGNQGSNFDIEMDICLEADNSEFGAGFLGLANSPRISTSSIGVGNSNLNYNFTVGEWYHVKWDADNGSTAIFVNDSYVGTVGEVAALYEGTQAFYQWIMLSIDNLSIGSYFNDMEKGLGDYQGMGMDYEIKVDEKTIFDEFETGFEVGGNAMLIEPAWSAESEAGIYYHFPVGPKGSENTNYIVDFDLALVPNINNTVDGTYFELWTNTASRRWIVGTVYTGRVENPGSDSETRDTTLFDWGEATKDNFHHVTYVFDGAKGYIYVDYTLVYEGFAGDVWNFDGDNYEECLGHVWNGSAIIDNYQVLDSKSYDLLVDKLPASGKSDTHGNANGTVTVNLDAEDYCAENGCITGLTHKTVAETCYSDGEWTTYCGVCGEVTETNVCPMYEHNWAGYDIYRKTDSGLVYTYCKNDGSNGCTERRYTTLPEEYTGTLYEYHDMSDDMIIVLDNGFSAMTTYKPLGQSDAEEIPTPNWTVTDDGKLYFNDFGSNYNQWNSRHNIPSNDWSITMDITYCGMHETNDTLDDPTKSDPLGYRKEFYFWAGGSNGLVIDAGYNAEEGYLFLRPDAMAGAAFIGVKKDFTMIEGENYVFTMRYSYDKDDNGVISNATVSLWVDGVKQLEYNTPDDAEYVLPMGSDTLSFIIFRDFAVNVAIDYMAVGSADLDVNPGKVFFGDADGDGVLTAADALVMRQFLAEVVAADELVVASHLLDVYADGAINAKDQVALRKAIAA